MLELSPQLLMLLWKVGNHSRSGPGWSESLGVGTMAAGLFSNKLHEFLACQFRTHNKKITN